MSYSEINQKHVGTKPKLFQLISETHSSQISRTNNKNESK
jgi:hypothetical protein